MQDQALVAAFLLDGKGAGRPMSWADIDSWQPSAGCLWVHLHRDAEETREWLEKRSGLDPLIVESLLAESTRPRCAPVADGVMLFLRGVNLNPGADPEDMVSIRLWVESTRIISVRTRRLMSVDDLRQALGRGDGPRDAGGFITQLAGQLVSRMSGVIADVDDNVDRLQEAVLESEDRQLRTDLTRLRREIIALRRYLAPQREALARFGQVKTSWINEFDSLHIREEVDHVMRLVEDLDAARERAAVTQEELNNRLSEQMNARMYVLSVVAAIFLPLGFLTGLFGINVGGIPLAEDPGGFSDIVLLMFTITGALVALFRWRRWF